MTKELDEEMLMDIDGNPDDTDGADVTLALPLGYPDGVELWNPDRSETLGRVKGGTVGVELLDKVVGSPDGLEADVPPEELLLADIVGSPDEAELVGNPLDEVFDEIVGSPEEAVELWYPDR